MPVEMSPQPASVQSAPSSGVGQPRHDVHFDHRAQQAQPRGASQFPPPQARVSQFPPPQQQPMQYPPQASPQYPPQGFSPMPPGVHQGPSSQGYGGPAQGYAPTPNPPNVRYNQPPQGNPGFPAPSLPPHFAQQQQAVPSTARASAFPGRRRSSAPPPESNVPVGPVEPQQILAASVFLGVPLFLATLVVAVLALRTDPPATEMEPVPAGATVSPAASGPKKGAAAPFVAPERAK
jgi:hypothetical protein